MTTLQKQLDDLHDRGEAAPCEGRWDDWESEEPTTKAKAATLCRTCPVRQACFDLSVTLPAPTGVWGGIDRTTKRTRPTTPTTVRAPRKPGIKKALPDDQQEFIRSACRQGFSVGRIATTLGLSFSKVRYFIEHNVPAEERRQPNRTPHTNRPEFRPHYTDDVVKMRDRDHLTWDTIAAQLGITPRKASTAYTAEARRGKAVGLRQAMTEEHRQQAAHLRSTGLSIRQVAEQMGQDYERVAAALRTYDARLRRAS